MTVTLSITVDDELGHDLNTVVAGGNRSAVVARAIREYRLAVMSSTTRKEVDESGYWW